MKKLFLLTAILLLFASCSQQAKQEPTKLKALVLYYSQTGATETVAKELARQTGADIERIEAITPYTGSYDKTIERVKTEMAADTVPGLQPVKSAINHYDVVFIGYPIWFGTYAPPVKALLNTYNFDGVKVVPFCTYGSGGLNSSTADMKAALPNAEVLKGYGVRRVRLGKISTEIERFLIENGYTSGKVEPLPDFSAQMPVTEAEKAIFNEACGDYFYPLGTPTTVGKRNIDGGEEYRFESVMQNREGADSKLIINVEKVGNAKAVFTNVER